MTVLLNQVGLQLLSRSVEMKAYLLTIGNQVAGAARERTSTPAGRYPHSGDPYLISGELHRGIETFVDADGKGAFVDIGSNTVSPRQGYPYPLHLELGIGSYGSVFPWITAAAEDIGLKLKKF